jgi:hypothetical protein
MVRVAGLGGWPGWLGLLAIALVLAFAYASLLSTIFGQWFQDARSPMGLLLFAAVGFLLIVTWLLGAVIR